MAKRGGAYLKNSKYTLIAVVLTALLTTDKKFLNLAAKSDSKIMVANPAIWLMEVIFNDQ